MMGNLTALVVSFYRTEYLELCVKSLRETYPEINIVVGNNGPANEEKEKICKKYHAKYYQLPFDCGLCVARNRLVDEIETEYTLIGDDDFFYRKDSNVDKMIKLCAEGEFDLIGGRIKEGGTIRNYQGFIEDHGNYFVYKSLDLNRESGLMTDAGLIYPCDITFNYFVAKTSCLKKVRWDEKIKVAYEHSSYFLDFKRAGYKVAFWPGAIVEHKPPINIKNIEEYEDYRVYRMRKNDKKRFFEKYGLQYVIDMAGRKDFYDNTNISSITFCITHFERKEGLKNLLFSIAKYYPFAKILIADQSKDFISKNYLSLYQKLFDAGLKNKPTAINMPFDCGLSLCRNKMIELVKTNYVLILEDDFEFTKETKVENLLDVLESDRRIGLVGGDVKEHHIPVRFNFYWRKKGKALKQEPDGDKYYNLDDITYKITGSTMNFFLAKKKLFDDIKWDNDIKINSEHTDFFYRLTKETEWLVVFTPNCSIQHNKELDREIKENYKEYRDRRDFFHILFDKHNINKLKYLDGYIVMRQDGNIITGKNL